jgi:hypothetical protein
MCWKVQNDYPFEGNQFPRKPQEGYWGGENGYDSYPIRQGRALVLPGCGAPTGFSVPQSEDDRIRPVPPARLLDICQVIRCTDPLS